eukprot:gb/GFBE01019794.1/.p1 GENE.gb/GFBE01019794.1/~~gb/GFBE01019794.1/.p1  ORF type:complete len:157 (+),score=26.51 gb/GFBE01019794.1/:1-471(+)
MKLLVLSLFALCASMKSRLKLQGSDAFFRHEEATHAALQDEDTQAFSTAKSHERESSSQAVARPQWIHFAKLDQQNQQQLPMALEECQPPFTSPSCLCQGGATRASDNTAEVWACSKYAASCNSAFTFSKRGVPYQCRSRRKNCVAVWPCKDITGL